LILIEPCNPLPGVTSRLASSEQSTPGTTAGARRAERSAGGGEHRGLGMPGGRFDDACAEAAIVAVGRQRRYHGAGIAAATHHIEVWNAARPAA
jgi:hypothetical protein